MSEKVISEIRKLVLQDPEIKTFIRDNQITEEIFDNNLARFINQY